MGSTAIATVSGFSGLSTLVSGEFRLKDQTVVKIPGGGVTKWSWNTILGDQVASEITGVIAALSEVQHDLWPHQGQAAEKSSPYMRSLDGRIARIVGDDSGDLDTKEIEAARIGDSDDYDCSKISYFCWQKGPQGQNVPPRANATSVIGILRPGESAPLFIRLSKTSSPKVQEFARKLRGQNVQPYQAIVSLALESVKGAKATYSRVVPKFVERVPDEVADIVRVYFEDVSPRLRGTLEKYAGKAALDTVPF